MYTMPITNAQLVRRNVHPNFQRRMTNTEITTVKNEIETLFIPFVEKNASIAKTGEKLIKSIKDKLAMIPRFYLLQKFVPQEIVLRDEQIEKLVQLDRNQQEFDYLFKKSQKNWAGEDAQTYSWLLDKIGLFKTPKYLQVSMNALQKFKKDTTNGLQNMTLKTIAPDVYAKAENLKNLKDEADTVLNPVFNIERKLLKLKSFLNFGITEDSIINKFLKSIREDIELINAKGSVDEKIKSIVIQNKENEITDENKEVLDNIYRPAHKVISRNMSKFKTVLKANPLSKIQSEQFDEILAQQKIEIHNLWSKIEEGKKEYYSKHKKKNDMGFQDYFVDKDTSF